MNKPTAWPAEVFKLPLRRHANAIARKNGYGRATRIIVGTTDRVVQHVSYGYRKKTTGQYVPNAYRNNFGWKNTYYQAAETVVEIDSRIWHSTIAE